MKRFTLISSIFVIAGLLAFTYFVAPTSASRPIPTTSSVEVPAFVYAGTVAEIVGKISPHPVSGGKIQIAARTHANEFVSCSAPRGAFTHEINGDGVPSSTGTSVGSFDTTGLAGRSIGFQSQYIGMGSGYGNSKSPCVDLIIVEPPPPDQCLSPVTIGVSDATGDGYPLAGNVYNWSYTMTVKACQDVTNVTAQGGTSGWVSTVSAIDPVGGTAHVRKQNKNNGHEVINWNIGRMNAGDTRTLTVTVTGWVKNGTLPGTVLFLSGNWSASYTDADLIRSKSDYTGRVSVMVGCDLCG